MADVRTELDQGVGLITLARPGRLNAVTSELLVELLAALRDLGDSPACGAIVLTGEGTSFCAGMDVRRGLASITSLTDDDPVETEHRGLRAGVDVILAMREVRPPIVAAVRGHAIGAGFALAAACDLRFAAPDARFGAPFVRLGVTAGDLGLSWFLPRLIGAGRAADVFFSAATLTAAEAERIGLVSRVVTDPLAEALAYARDLAELPGYGVSVTKQLLDASAGAGLREHLDSEARAQVIGLLTARSREAVAQLSSQRSPDRSRR